MHAPLAVNSVPVYDPFLVSHRAGNDLLRRAEERGITHVEADLHLLRGRLEVRPLKTVGPLPILWDQWTLAAPWRPRLLIDRLLAAAGPRTRLMLDLKGRDRRLGAQLARALDADAGARELTICSRNWRHARRSASCTRSAVAGNSGCCHGDSGWPASRSIASSSTRRSRAR